MPIVHVPSSLRALTDGRAAFEVEGSTLGQVLAAVGRECPALVARLIEDGAIREDMAIAIDGSILEGGELLQVVSPMADIYLVPPIGGGGGSNDQRYVSAMLMRLSGSTAARASQTGEYCADRGSGDH